MRHKIIYGSCIDTNRVIDKLIASEYKRTVVITLNSCGISAKDNGAVYMTAPNASVMNKFIKAALRMQPERLIVITDADNLDAISDTLIAMNCGIYTIIAVETPDESTIQPMDFVDFITEGCDIDIENVSEYSKTDIDTATGTKTTAQSIQDKRPSIKPRDIP